MGGECSMHSVIRNTYKILLENMKRKELSYDLDVDGRIIIMCGVDSSG
jgi:hypothetical protein